MNTVTEEQYQKFLESGFEITTHGGDPNIKNTQQIDHSYMPWYRWSSDEPWIKSEFRSQHKLRAWAIIQFSNNQITNK
jgi:hypothetical protein